MVSGLREYRNLIHPGVEIREDLEPTESKADLAFDVLKEITEKFRSVPTHS
jgi:hypothetical protein